MRRRLLGILAWLTRAPVLYGDGEADDSLALRAWGAGKLVRTPDGLGWWRELDGQSFRLREAIVITAPRLRLSNVYVNTDVLDEIEKLN